MQAEKNEEVIAKDGVEVSTKDSVTYLTLRNRGMRCPQCVCNGQTSTLHTGVGMCTSAGIETYYDSDGKFHKHDRNVTRGDWTCTNGHAGTVRTVRSCPQSSCTKQGYEILTTDPAEYKAAREERRRIAEEKRKEEERLKNPASTQSQSTSIGIGSIGTGIYTTLSYTGSSMYAPLYYSAPAVYTLPTVQVNVLQVKITVNGVEYEGSLYPCVQSEVKTEQSQKNEV